MIGGNENEKKNTSCDRIGIGICNDVVIGRMRQKGKIEANINPDTPVEQVAFPLKETAELSFITNAPARTTQDPNQREIFKKLRKSRRMYILTGNMLCSGLVCG